MTIAYNKKSQTSRRRALRNSMPKAEVILWKELSRKKMHGYKFRRQYGVDQYVLDFYCPRLKLAIEVDGDSHFVLGSEEQDKVRQEYIESFGIHFLRFSNEDVCKNIVGVCRVIFDKVEEIRLGDEK
ncbi:MAG: endonuclease domain-containing protein [Bacteroidota bacterium]|jgi:very-short-patch-repair endonuclease